MPPTHPARRLDVLDAPDGRVAELIGGARRPRARAASGLGAAPRMAFRWGRTRPGTDGSWTSPRFTSAPRTCWRPTSGAVGAGQCRASRPRHATASSPTGCARCSAPAPTSTTTPRSATSTAAEARAICGFSTPTRVRRRPSRRMRDRGRGPGADGCCPRRPCRVGASRASATDSTCWTLTPPDRAATVRMQSGLDPRARAVPPGRARRRAGRGLGGES